MVKIKCEWGDHYLGHDNPLGLCDVCCRFPSTIKRITMYDILTQEQIKQARDIYREMSQYGCQQRLHDEIVVPNLAHINKKLGQENDPMFLSYLLQYSLGQEEK